MSFDPSKRVAVRVSDVDKARFWYEVKLYLKVMGIMLPIAALAVWAIIEWWDRVGY